MRLARSKDSSADGACACRCALAGCCCCCRFCASSWLITSCIDCCCCRPPPRVVRALGRLRDTELAPPRAQLLLPLCLHLLQFLPRADEGGCAAAALASSATSAPAPCREAAAVPNSSGKGPVALPKRRRIHRGGSSALRSDAAAEAEFEVSS